VRVCVCVGGSQFDGGGDVFVWTWEGCVRQRATADTHRHEGGRGTHAVDDVRRVVEDVAAEEQGAEETARKNMKWERGGGRHSLAEGRMGWQEKTNGERVLFLTCKGRKSSIQELTWRCPKE
jgi:hypothetical protein